MALALWELPRTYWNRAQASARDLYEDSHEKLRVFGEFGATGRFELCGVCGEALRRAVSLASIDMAA